MFTWWLLPIEGLDVEEKQVISFTNSEGVAVTAQFGIFDA